MHRTWTGDSFHIGYYTCFNAILPNHPTLALSHTHGEVWVSLLWGPCFFLLGSSVYNVLSVLCNFWGLYGGFNVNLLQEGLCHTQVCCTQSPCPRGRPLLTHISAGDTQTQFWLSLCGLGVRFVHFPGLSSSGDQVLGERTVLGGPCVLITSLVPAAWFPGCAVRALSQMCHMSPLES